MNRAGFIAVAVMATCGAHAGDFGTVQAAALAGLSECRALQSNARLECAGAVLRTSDGYTVGPLSTGTAEHFALHASRTTLAGLFHTHPGSADLDHVFSADDVDTAHALGVPSYIATDNGMHARALIPGDVRCTTAHHTCTGVTVF